MDEEFIKKVTNKAKLVLAGTGIAASLLTGCGSNQKKVAINPVKIESIDYNKVSDDKIISIPEDCKATIIQTLSKIDKVYSSKGLNDSITFSDLKKLNSELSINVTTNEDLSFLNYCNNLKSLSILFNNNSKIADLNSITELPNLENLSIVNFLSNDTYYINETNGKFILNSPKLKSLNLNFCGIDPAIINKLNNIQMLSINSLCHPEDIDFYNLKKLNTVVLNGGLYDDPIYLDDNMINTLKNCNINIAINNNSDYTLSDEMKINEQLNNIVATLPINGKSSDHDKLNAVLYYVLSIYNYDPDVIDNNQDIDYDKYYNNGKLYGALTRNNIICGNYSAIMQALLNRVGMNTHLLESSNHSWNMVKVNSEYYYVDATWLDEEEMIKNITPFSSATFNENSATALKNGDIYNNDIFPAYMMNANKNIEEHHISTNKPSDEALSMDTMSKYSLAEDITTKIYYIKASGLVLPVMGGALVGILIPLGLAKAATAINKKIKKNSDIDKTKKL